MAELTLKQASATSAKATRMFRFVMILDTYSPTNQSSQIKNRGSQNKPNLKAQLKSRQESDHMSKSEGKPTPARKSFELDDSSIDTVVAHNSAPTDNHISFSYSPQAGSGSHSSIYVTPYGKPGQSRSTRSSSKRNHPASVPRPLDTTRVVLRNQKKYFIKRPRRGRRGSYGKKDYSGMRIDNYRYTPATLLFESRAFSQQFKGAAIPNIVFSYTEHLGRFTPF